jgi:hypothetical protein
MSLINRHNGCIAITLFKFGNKQLELVYCPKGEVIEPHVHEHIDGTMIMLGGEAFGTIGDQSGFTGWYDIGRRFKVPRNCSHHATVTGRFFLFLNYEKWTGQTPTSAAIDFKAV